MFDLSKRIKEAKAPNTGYPFGCYQVQLNKLELTEKKGKDGAMKDYFIWHLRIVDVRHETSIGKAGYIGTIERDFASDFGVTDNVSLLAAFHGSAFEAFQKLDGAEQNSFTQGLTNEKALLEKPLQALLNVLPDAKGYRRFTSAPTSAIAEFLPVPYVPVEFKPEKKDEPASSGTAATAPTA